MNTLLIHKGVYTQEEFKNPSYIACIAVNYKTS
jgi:hypothetical protein